MLGPLVIPLLSSKNPEVFRVTFGPFRFPQTPSLSHWDPLVNPLDTLGPSRLPILPYKSSEDQSVINCGFLDLPLDHLVHPKVPLPPLTPQTPSCTCPHDPHLDL